MSAPMKIEDKWVEIAAKEAFKSHWPKDDWGRFKPGDVVPELYLAIGRAILSAVAPLIRAKVLEEAAVVADTHGTAMAGEVWVATTIATRIRALASNGEKPDAA